jgi:DASH complex subunit ASK1
MAQSSTAANPVLQPPFFLIPGINPSSTISAQTEQIDQLNTLLLQEIDANFARFHQIVTTRILPEIKRFAIAGEPTREAAKVGHPPNHQTRMIELI